MQSPHPWRVARRPRTRCALRAGRAGAATPRAGSAAGPRRVARPARVWAPRRPPPPPPPAPRVAAAHTAHRVAVNGSSDGVPGLLTGARGCPLPSKLRRRAPETPWERGRAEAARGRGGSAGARRQRGGAEAGAGTHEVAAGGEAAGVRRRGTPPRAKRVVKQGTQLPERRRGRRRAQHALRESRVAHQLLPRRPAALSGQRPAARPWRSQGAARASKAAQRLCSWLQSSARSSSEDSAWRGRARVSERERERASACATRARLRAAQAAARSLRRCSSVGRGMRGAPRPRRRGGASPPRTPQALRESGPPLATARRRQASRATDAQRKSADSRSEPGPRGAREARAGGTWMLRQQHERRWKCTASCAARSASTRASSAPAAPRAAPVCVPASAASRSGARWGPSSARTRRCPACSASGGPSAPPPAFPPDPREPSPPLETDAPPGERVAGERVGERVGLVDVRGAAAARAQWAMRWASARSVLPQPAARPGGPVTAQHTPAAPVC